MNPYINCFTGSIIHTLGDTAITESNIVLLGGGYLLKAGSDEYGYPEITFPVQHCGETALKKLGIEFSLHPINKTYEVNELARLCEKYNNGVIAWTNSSHLSYSSLYSINLGYLHSIVIQSITDSQAYIFDPLVVDILPYAIEGRLSLENLEQALVDKVKTNTYDLMGSLLKIHPTEAGKLCKNKKEICMNDLTY